jgi:hypothetical protein
VHKSSVSKDFANQIMSILLILCHNGNFVTWTVISLTAAKFKPHMLYVWLRLVLCCEHAHPHEFVWLLLVCCLHNFAIVYNRIHMQGWKPCANYEPVCTLGNIQWCEEPCSAGAAILRSMCLPLIPRRGKRKSLLIWSVPYRGFV